MREKRRNGIPGTENRTNKLEKKGHDIWGKIDCSNSRMEARLNVDWLVAGKKGWKL